MSGGFPLRSDRPWHGAEYDAVPGAGDPTDSILHGTNHTSCTCTCHAGTLPGARRRECADHVRDFADRPVARTHRREDRGDLLTSWPLANRPPYAIRERVAPTPSCQQGLLVAVLLLDEDMAMI